MTRDRGSVTVITMGLVAVAGALCLGAARLGAAAVAQARADAAADASALAAADSLALREGEDAAVRAATATAEANGGRLTRCECAGSIATVSVVVRAPVVGTPARSTARAEVREECRLGCDGPERDEPG